MDFFLAASLVLIAAAVVLVYRVKRRKKPRHLTFGKRTLSHKKRRRHSLLNNSKGKVIPFPVNSHQSPEEERSSPQTRK